MSKGEQPDDSAANAQLAEEQAQEHYAQQQAWDTVHSQIEEQGGLNWATQSVTNAPAGTPTPSPPNAPIVGIPSPTKLPNMPTANLSGDQTQAANKAAVSK